MSEVDALLERWRVRDERYRHGWTHRSGVMGTQLSTAEESAIRAYRRREIEALPPPERPDAWRMYRAWAPPVPMR